MLRRGCCCDFARSSQSFISIFKQRSSSPRVRWAARALTSFHIWLERAGELETKCSGVLSRKKRRVRRSQALHKLSDAQFRATTREFELVLWARVHPRWQPGQPRMSASTRARRTTTRKLLLPLQPRDVHRPLPTGDIRKNLETKLGALQIRQVLNRRIQLHLIALTLQQPPYHTIIFQRRNRTRRINNRPTWTGRQHCRTQQRILSLGQLLRPRQSPRLHLALLNQVPLTRTGRIEQHPIKFTRRLQPKFISIIPSRPHPFQIGWRHMLPQHLIQAPAPRGRKLIRNQLHT